MSANHHTALDVADWFLRNKELCRGEDITHLKLQKLVFYAQAWSLTFRDQRLFEEDFQAWAHGPVAPSLYRAFAGHGWNPLLAPTTRAAANFDEDTIDLLKDVMEIYGAYSAKRLESMTHIEGPWRDARGSLKAEERSTAVISKQSISQYYEKLIMEDEDDTPQQDS